MGEQEPTAQHASVMLPDQPPDRVAVCGPPLSHIPQSAARFEEGLLRRCRRDRQGLGDLRHREARELSHQQCRALALGEGAQVRKQARKPFALLQCALWNIVLGGDQGGLEDPDILASAPAQKADRLVVDDPEQPGSDGEIALADAKRDERARHRVLKHVLRLLGVAQDRAAVAEERLVMALVELGERLPAPA